MSSPPVTPAAAAPSGPSSRASPLPLLIKKSRPSRLAAFRARIRAHLSRSSHVFLLGLLVACGIEVVVDWNSTLFEINVLRDGMRQRGLNYSRILAHAAVDPMLSFDPEALDRLCEGLFHDEDVVFIRFTDQQGTVMLDRLREKYAAGFAKRRKLPFADYYASQMRRDIGGILTDPDMLAQRMASSRHRDFVQAWNDFFARLERRFTGPKPQVERRGAVVLYQDRLKRKPDGHDAEVTYALSTVTDERGEDLGVVLVAFSMESVNSQIVKKYLKGLGMVVFFVGLILIQNILSRREKLRLYELEERQRAAKQALREALPAGTGDTIDLGALTVAGGLLQSEGIVDGVAWDLLAPGESGSPSELLLLVIDPDGEGVSAVATSLHVLRTFRQRRAAGLPADFLSELQALGQAALTIPLTRPLHLWLLRLDLPSGAIDGVCSPMGGAWVLHPRVAGRSDTPSLLELVETPLCSTAETPPGLMGPLFSFRGELPPGALLCGLFTGAGRPTQKRDTDGHALADHLLRTRRSKAELGAVAAAASGWARGRLIPGKGDVLVLLAARSAPPDPESAP